MSLQGFVSAAHWHLYRMMLFPFQRLRVPCGSQWDRGAQLGNQFIEVLWQACCEALPSKRNNSNINHHPSAFIIIHHQSSSIINPSWIVNPLIHHHHSSIPHESFIPHQSLIHQQLCSIIINPSWILINHDHRYSQSHYYYLSISKYCHTYHRDESYQPVVVQSDLLQTGHFFTTLNKVNRRMLSGKQMHSLKLTASSPLKKQAIPKSDMHSSTHPIFQVKKARFLFVSGI